MTDKEFSAWEDWFGAIRKVVIEGEMDIINECNEEEKRKKLLILGRFAAGECKKLLREATQNATDKQLMNIAHWVSLLFGTCDMVADVIAKGDKDKEDKDDE